MSKHARAREIVDQVFMTYWGRMAEWAGAGSDVEAPDLNGILVDALDAYAAAALARAVEAEREVWRARCEQYRAALTILAECDHGDEATCGCRDRAMVMVAALRPGAPDGGADGRT